MVIVILMMLSHHGLSHHVEWLVGANVLENRAVSIFSPEAQKIITLSK
jgi:hypothetical protein